MAHVNRLNPHMARKMYAEVVDDVTKILTLDPRRVKLLAVRAEAYYRLGQYAESLADLQRLQQAGGNVNPNTIETLKKLIATPPDPNDPNAPQPEPTTN